VLRALLSKIEKAGSGFIPGVVGIFGRKLLWFSGHRVVSDALSMHLVKSIHAPWTRVLS
jgi:hypothetical protein